MIRKMEKGCNVVMLDVSELTQTALKDKKDCEFPLTEGGIKKVKAVQDGKKFRWAKCLKSYSHQSGIYRHQLECKLARQSRNKIPILLFPEKELEKTFTCEKCYAMFDRIGKLEDYKQRKHLNPTEYECTLCRKKYKRLDH